MIIAAVSVERVEFYVFFVVVGILRSRAENVQRVLVELEIPRSLSRNMPYDVGISLSASSEPS